LVDAHDLDALGDQPFGGGAADARAALGEVALAHEPVAAGADQHDGAGVD